MRCFFLFLTLISLRAPAAQITLQPGESVTLKPKDETVVTCVDASIKANKKTACVSPVSDPECKGLFNGDLCRKDAQKGTCVGQTSLHGLECKCLL